MESALEWNDEGARLYQLKSYSEAINAFLMAIKLDRKNADFHKNLANAYFNSNQWDKANECYQKAIQMNNKNWIFFVDFGLILVVQKRYKEALKQYLIAQNLSPNQIEIRTNLADLYYLLNEWQQSIILSQQILKQEPSNLPALNRIGLCYFRQNLFNQALEFFNKGLSLSPNNATVLHEIGQLYLTRKQTPDEYNLGIKFILNAYKVNPYDESIVVSVVEFYAKDFFFGTIHSILTKFLEKIPNNAAIQNLLGCMYLKVNRFQDAQMCFSIALNIDPSKKEYQADLDKCVQLLSYWNETPTKLLNAMNDESKRQEIDLYFGIYYFSKGDFRTASHSLSLFLKYNQNDEVGIFLYGLCHYLYQDFKVGLKILLLYSSVRPDNWRTWFILAFFEKSPDYLAKVHEIKPELNELFPSVQSMIETATVDDLIGITLIWVNTII